MYSCVIDVGSGAITGHSSFGLSTIFLILSIRPGRASDAVVPAADPEADPPPAIAAACTAAIAGRGGSGGGGAVGPLLMLCPQAPQKRALGGMGFWQLGQFIGSSVRRVTASHVRPQIIFPVLKEAMAAVVRPG